MKIILASASPRRYEILKKHGIVPVVVPSDVDESLTPEMEARPVSEIVMYLAHQKARAVYELLIGDDACRRNDDEDSDPAFVLAADTVVYKDRIIGKPVDERDAFEILRSLRASSHQVITGVSLIDMRGGTETRLYDITEVQFKDYPDEEIYRYIREEAPYDKSGSYAVQSSWSKNVDRVDGDIENVMGLPWHRIAPLIERDASSPPSK
ncbi:MAG: Maf family protein [Clostridiales Family XIII bacterium]|jgi:septum formation protein|nr:Maf family protein [Clostridiales Family XIII bacterium]